MCTEGRGGEDDVEESCDARTKRVYTLLFEEKAPPTAGRRQGSLTARRNESPSKGRGKHE